MTIEYIAEKFARLLAESTELQNKAKPFGDIWYYYEGRKDVAKYFLELAKIHEAVQECRRELGLVA